MAFSVMSLLGRAKTAQTAAMLDFGDAFIVHSRNKLADGFLRTKMEWCLTIDDDMVVPFGNAPLFNSFTGFNLHERHAGLNVIDRLLSHGKTLVGALYFGRWRHGKAMYGEGSDPQELKFAKRGPHDNLVKPTRWVGTGCMLIHRSVFEDIEKKFPHLARGTDGSGGQWFTSSEHDLRIAAEKALTQECADGMATIKTALSYSKRHSSMGMGEDVQFCIRATQAGHQPHVDLGCLAGHIGSYCYGEPTK